MLHRICPRIALAALVTLLGVASSAMADDYAVDGAHSGVNFKISHLGLSWIQGRFDEFGGRFIVDTANPEKSSFELKINPASVDTNNQKRDEHLRGPDFFNVKQFPAMSFRSTSVQPMQGGFKVTGDFTMHGVTKPITVELVGGRTSEFPKGVTRTGYSAEFAIKRAEFGMETGTPMIGNQIYCAVSFEGTKQ